VASGKAGRLRLLAAAASTARLALLAAACSTPAQGVQRGDSPSSSLNVELDWVPNPDHTSLYYAQRKGYFARQHLTVNFRVPSSAADPLKLVGLNTADLAISYEPGLRTSCMRLAAWASFGSWLRARKLLPAAPDAAAIMTDRYLPYRSCQMAP
jgi:hypothetical protein